MTKAQAAARKWVQRYDEWGMAIAWTVGKEGDDAKVCRESWDKTARKMGDDLDLEAGQFAERIKTKNPVCVLRSSGLFAVECDGSEDLKIWREFNAPETLVIQSSDPTKRHFYFTLPDDAPYEFVAVRIEAGKLKADSGRYFVIPPALHPSGVEYEVVHDVPIAELPLGTLDMLLVDAGRGMEEEKKRTRDPEGGTFTKGERHDFLVRRLGQLCRAGLTQEACEDALLAENEARCEPPRAESYVRNLVRRNYDGWIAGEEEESSPRRKKQRQRRNIEVEVWDDNEAEPIADILMVSDILDAIENNPPPECIPFSWFGGFDLERSWLILLGAYAKDGKSLLASQAALEQVAAGYRVTYVTNELTHIEVVKRMILQSGDADTLDSYNELLRVVYAPDFAHVSSYLEQHETDVIYIDNMHHMVWTDHNDLRAYAREFKHAAVKYNVAVVCLGQMNPRRQAENTQPRPDQASWRGGSDPIHVCDQVIGLFREKGSDGSKRKESEIFHVINRHGEERMHRATFDRHTLTFVQRSAATMLPDEDVDFEADPSENGGWHPDDADPYHDLGGLY